MLHTAEGLLQALGAVLLSATAAEAGLAGSAHDLSHLSWSGGMACLPCHTTRDANDVRTPLWNHERSAAPIIPYEGVTGSLDATIDAPGGGVSAACLSCHDGTVALDAFGGASGSAQRIDPTKRIGPDLSRDHPVGFVYDSSLAARDGELRDPATAESGLGGTIAEDMLVDGRMECSSCHDVHGRDGLPSLLLKSNARSALCLTCHDK
ncbi:MAG: cytochrome c3 family protein [Planctomycetota bacterium]|jgi:predicted CXXCH cytochrome family protein